MTDDAQQVRYKGPGQWRSQADDVQEPTRPSAEALDPPRPGLGKGKPEPEPQ